MPFFHVKCGFLGRSFSKPNSYSCSFGCITCRDHCTQNSDANAENNPKIKLIFFQVTGIHFIAYAVSKLVSSHRYFAAWQEKSREASRSVFHAMAFKQMV